MTIITDGMTGDHRRCDALFSEAEQQVAEGDCWEQGAARFEAFHGVIEHHFEMEESVLFPRFEQRTRQAGGPTQMMRMEHLQMRQLLNEMAAAVQRRDGECYLGLTETLMMIMQQHNMKEERILYPMTDQAFAGEAAQVLEEMQSL